MWAVIKDGQIEIVMKTRSQAREIAGEIGGTVKKCHVTV